MYASLVTGSKSHKSVTKEKSRILWSYYNNNVRPIILSPSLAPSSV